jgi:hypothetical protein
MLKQVFWFLNFFNAVTRIGSLLWLLTQELEFFALVAQTRIVILFVLITRAKLVIFYFVAQTRI